MSHASNYDRFSQYVQQFHGADFLDNAVKLASGDRVLDFGCGTGNWLIDLARRVGSSGFVVGVDPDEDRIAIAKSRLNDHAHANIQVHRGSIDETAKFAPYDVVIANHVIHWIPREEQEKILKGIYGQLKAGGKFGFTTARVLMGYVRDVSAIQYKNSYDDFLTAVGWALRPLSDWEKLLKNAGFEIVHGVEEERGFLLPNYEAFLTWWEATCLGCFSAAHVIEDRVGDYERLLKKYGWKKDEPINPSAILIEVIARKPKGD